jgi:hypothetical protein
MIEFANSYIEAIAAIVWICATCFMAGYLVCLIQWTITDWRELP